MTPALPEHDRTDIPVAAIPLLGEFYIPNAAGVAGSDCKDVTFRKLRIALFFSARSYVPTLRKHVTRIVLICSQEKMVRVHAAPIDDVADRVVLVAIVQNSKAVWNWATEQLKGNPVGSTWRALVATAADLPVAFFDAESCPKKATKLVLFADELKESVDQFRASSDDAGSGTEFPLSAPDGTGASIEPKLDATGFADTLNERHAGLL